MRLCSESRRAPTLASCCSDRSFVVLRRGEWVLLLSIFHIYSNLYNFVSSISITLSKSTHLLMHSNYNIQSFFISWSLCLFFPSDHQLSFASPLTVQSSHQSTSYFMVLPSNTLSSCFDAASLTLIPLFIPTINSTHPLSSSRETSKTSLVASPHIS